MPLSARCVHAASAFAIDHPLNLKSGAKDTRTKRFATAERH